MFPLTQLAESDSAYEEAVSIVKKYKKPSISFVQPYLKIGYNRAARLLERMESERLVTSMNRTGVRFMA